MIVILHLILKMMKLSLPNRVLDMYVLIGEVKKKRFLLKSLFMFHILLNYTYTCSHSFSYVTENTLVDSNFSHKAYYWQFLFSGNMDNNLLILAYQFIAFTCIVRRFQHTEAIYVIQNLKPPRAIDNFEGIIWH